MLFRKEKQLEIEHSIGYSSTVDGTYEFESGLHVQGTFKGTLVPKKDTSKKPKLTGLMISPTGRVFLENIIPPHFDLVMVAGEIEGTFTCEQLVIMSTGKVHSAAGCIKVKKLKVSEGGILDAYCKTGDDTKKTPPSADNEKNFSERKTNISQGLING